MRTHERAWILRAGVVVVAAAASLFGLASPALAEKPSISYNLSSGTLQSGGPPANLTFQVTNNNQNTPGTDDSAVIKVTVTINEISCEGECDLTQAIKPGESADFSASLKPGSVPAGETRSGKLRIRAEIAGESDVVERDISVQGPAAPPAPQSVPSVSGIVKNVTNAVPIENATVYLQDSQSKQWQVGTGKDGKFKFVSTTEKPIAPGTISIIVEKEGWQKSQGIAVVANAGQPLNVPTIMLQPVLSATATPSVTTVAPTSEVSPLEEGNPGDVLPNEQEGGISWVLIAIGGLLVLLGIGAIVMLFLRKRADGDDGDDGDRPTPRRGVPTRVPAAHGGVRPGPPGRRGPPDRTTVMRGPGGPPNDPTRAVRPPVSPGPRGADQTMIARSPLADAPTMLHGRNPADPYGQQPRQNGASGGGYGAPYGAGGAYPGPPPGYQGPPAHHADPYGQARPSYGEPYGADPYGGHAQGGPGGAHGYEQQGGGRGQQPPGDPRSPRPVQPPEQADRRLDWLD